MSVYLLRRRLRRILHKRDHTVLRIRKRMNNNNCRYLFAIILLQLFGISCFYLVVCMCLFCQWKLSRMLVNFARAVLFFRLGRNLLFGRKTIYNEDMLF